MISKVNLTVLENRRLLFGIGIVCVLITLLAIKSGYGYHRNTIVELSTYEEALRISSQVLSRGSEIENLIDRGVERLTKLEEGLLSADKPSIGAAKLQEAVKKIALKRRISIKSEKALNAKESGEYIMIPVEFRFTAQLTQLNRLLYDIESSKLLMGVRSLHITTPDRMNPVNLELTLVVEGVIRKMGD